MTQEETESDEIEVEEVSDPEEYVQERRLKDIYDAKQKVRERKLRAKEIQLDNEYKRNPTLDAVRLYRTAVENYLTELRPLFLEDKKGTQYWYNLDMGEMVIEPPERDDYSHGDEPEPKSIELVGLNCIFEIPEPIVAEWEASICRKGLGIVERKTETVSQKASLTFSHLDMIVQNANQFLAEKGFELDPVEESDPAEI